MREVHFYRAATGQCAVEEFLDSLSGKQAQKIVWVLRLVEELRSVPTQYLKKLSGAGNLWEVRAQHGGEAFRLLGFFESPSALVLTNGFSKKSRKVPRREIDIAERRRRDYLRRRADDE